MDPTVPGTWHAGSSWSQEGVLSGPSLGRGWLGRSSLQCEDWFSSNATGEGETWHFQLFMAVH